VSEVSRCDRVRSVGDDRELAWLPLVVRDVRTLLGSHDLDDMEPTAFAEIVRRGVLVARGGREYPIAECGAPILDAGETVLGVVLVFAT
jgi:DNA-binding IclR family transcriptional regulator